MFPNQGGGERDDAASSCFIKNVSGETIPVHSFVKVTPLTKLANGTWVVQGDKPDDEEGAIYVVSGRAEIAAGTTGTGYWIGEKPVPVRVAVYSSVTPVQDIGPADGEWTADGEGSGFKCVGTFEDGDMAWIVRIGGGSCKEQWKIIVWGNPTGGSVTIPTTINDVTEDITLSYNATESDVLDAFEEHPEVDAGDIFAEFFGGRFPSHELILEFPGIEDVRLGAPSLSFTGGSNPFAHFRKCCG